MAILVQQSEATAAYRRMYFHCVDATDGITAEAGEVGGQPQWSLNGVAWGNTTGVLVAMGNGRYYVELVAATEVNNLGVIEGRYKSANTAESVGTTLQVVPYDPYDGVRMGLTALPNAIPQAAGGIVTSTLGAEFDSRTLPSADYVVVGDTIAAVTTVTTVTNGLTTGNVNVAAGVIESNVIQIDGSATNGNNATLNLLSLNIQNNLGDAVVIAATGANGDGVSVLGNGTGHGIKSTGGATSGNGISLAGGAPNGQGLYSQGVGTGSGIRADGGTDGFYGAGASNGHGMLLAGNGTGDGLSITGGATGHGIHSSGGATSGNGITAEAATEGDGIYALAKGTDEHGIYAVGGNTTGDGIKAVAATEGMGIHASAIGTAKHGIYSIGGSVSGDGIYATAGTDGDGISATATGNNSGMLLTGAGTGDGLSAVAGATGHGIECSATSGDGIKSTGATNGHGMELIGAGTGEGILLNGANTGKGGAVNVAVYTTVAAVTTPDTVFTLTAGVATNDAYVNMICAIYDVSGGFWEARKIDAYVGATRTVTVDTDYSFTIQAGVDLVRLFYSAYAPTVAAGGGATAAQVWEYDVDAIITAGQAGDYQKMFGGGRYG
ncbi:MAG: hypothetical protein MUO31_06775 [Thermodesulfovibrionales bacterium]|nr:hypothetical protein [Thermodesulfovibrionales bacterium]